MKRLALLVFACFAAAQSEDDGEASAFFVAGKVEGADGKRIEIALWDALAPARFLAKGEADGAGSFKLGVAQSTAGRREHPFGPVLVVVKGKGLAQRRVEAAAGSDKVEVRTALSKPVEGVVLDAAGHPLPAAVVHAERAGIVEKTTTDEAGRYAFVQFDGRPRITIVGVGFTYRPADPARVTMPAVTMREGKLVTNEGGPLVGARIRDGARDIAVTDDAGGYVVPVVAPGAGIRPARYTVYCEGFETAPLSDQPVRAAEPLAGRVVDGEGKSVADARVSIRAGGADLVAWTNELGVFAFPALPIGMVELAAAKTGCLPASVRVEAGRAADRVTLHLERGAEVAGTVKFKDAVVAGVRVVAGTAVAYTDDAGAFRLRGLTKGAAVSASTVGLRSRPAPPRDGMTLELHDKLPISGRLASDSGEPLEGVVVECAAQGQDTPMTSTTDARGLFDFGSLPIRHYFLLAVPDKHAALAASVVPGDPLRLTARSRFGEKTLRVRLDVDAGAASTVSIRRKEQPRVRRTARGPNAFFRGLMEGVYEVVAEAELHRPARFDLELDRSRTVKKSLERGGTLHITASPGAKVIVQTLHGKPAPIVTMALANGTKTLRGFGPGKYRFIARAKGELIVLGTVELGPNAPPEKLDLRGGPAAELVVTVNDGADPVVGARVTIEKDGFVSPRPARTDEKGQAGFDRLFLGTVTVRAKKGEAEGV
ncbi:MAG: carboxypeptidase-like regulatory domain-containing protein, partial [Planctomycetota bacterium]